MNDTKNACVAYYFANKLLNENALHNNPQQAIKNILTIKLSSRQYAKIINILKSTIVNNHNGIYVNSIENIKGQEGTNCLFVLTTDLAEYLFKNKSENNKTKNKLYVALTRSLEKLTILISIEVEQKYGRDFILNYMQEYTS